METVSRQETWIPQVIDGIAIIIPHLHWHYQHRREISTQMAPQPHPGREVSLKDKNCAFMRHR
ncbi:uncharacterized protein BO80DRAFT_422006 [Aspergillus ibericus CBS 121593]|uniref:Uncharacterized protein n=1 Tax=Aspergillus ibericus CBS 121593 TaxID=1448316 RepID=A0A395HA23_9EURO|nr:hypothetical protein BO80DRAFT_422006 [Aspergillus ibericus CBS 121593]RAL04767.1 hypothetical protein BO80DRAFT_422006 [Aspergillus ibericus CBS 121593]